jgi:outer membrane protein OmpA-like peptidoglycan-associated protein
MTRKPALLALLGCTTLAGCAITDPTAPSDRPTAAQPKAPDPAQLAQVGFGAAAQFVRCQSTACPRPTPKTLARRRAANEQRHLPNLASMAASGPSPALLRSGSATGASAMSIADPAPRSPALAELQAPRALSRAPGAPGHHTVTILFTPASAHVGPDGQARIAAAPVQGATRLTVHGHADPTGNAADNLRLARSRAQAVAAQLRIAHPALRRVRIDVVADGKCCGPGGRRSAASHAHQRRVEIVIERQEPDP